MTLNHSSGPISSLFVAADVANDVGNVLVTLFLVGNEGRIVVVIVLNGIVDFDVVFRFGNHGLDLAGILFGVGLLQRALGLGERLHQFDAVQPEPLERVEQGDGFPVRSFRDLVEFIATKVDPDLGDQAWQAGAATGTLYSVTIKVGNKRATAEVAAR